MWAVLAGFTVALGPLAMFNLYFMPYWINVMWLDAVTYLHHHGPEDESKIPWYRGEVMLQHIFRDVARFNEAHIVGSWCCGDPHCGVLRHEGYLS